MLFKWSSVVMAVAQVHGSLMKVAKDLFCPRGELFMLGMTICWSGLFHHVNKMATTIHLVNQLNGQQRSLFRQSALLNVKNWATYATKTAGPIQINASVDANTIISRWKIERRRRNAGEVVLVSVNLAFVNAQQRGICVGRDAEHLYSDLSFKIESNLLSSSSNVIL